MTNNKKEVTMEKIVSLCKRRGFIFPGSEIYGGLANTWDYGPLGVELKNNIQQLWWKRFVQSRDDMVGLDAAVLMNAEVWKASGHLENFSDPLVECKKCHTRFRADQLINENDLKKLNKEINKLFSNFFNSISIYDLVDESQSKLVNLEELLNRELKYFIEENKNYSIREQEIIVKFFEERFKEVAKGTYSKENIDIDRDEEGYIHAHSDIMGILESELKEISLGNLIISIYLDRNAECPICKERSWSPAKQFNLMFKTYIGPAEEQANVAYFRPEIAQAMFVNFKNVLDTTRRKLPFGIAAQGKAFRNEITPGNFIFRTREFNLMELEYFVREGDWENRFEYWLKEMREWLKELGVNLKHIHEVEIPAGERAHYSKRTVDFEYEYPFGQNELYGLAYRTDFDLKRHYQTAPYLDQDSGEQFYPQVIEPTFGLDRSVLVALLEAYSEEKDRAVLKLPQKLAPVKIAVFPLLKNKPELVRLAREIYDNLRSHFMVVWDERGNIGKRYYAQDEIGTPFCLTVDFDSLKNGDVTVRDRDTMKQERVKIEKLGEYFREKLKF